VQFPEETKMLQFVSNAPVRVKLKIDGKARTKDHLCFEELDEGIQSDVSARLQKELGLGELPSLAKLLEFEVTDMPLKGHETHTVGKLAKFLQEMYPERAFRVMPIYRALLSEVAVRNNNQEQIAAYEDLIRLKSISRRRFSELLVTAGVSRVELKWETVEGRLNSEQAPLPMIQELRREWEGVELDRLSTADVVHLRLWELIKKSCGIHRAIPKLRDAVETVYAELVLEVDSSWPFSETYLKTAIVMGVYESE
jgi:Cap4-like dsDNA endonuclease family protein